MTNDEKECGHYICKNGHKFPFFSALFSCQTLEYHCPECMSKECKEWKEVTKEKGNVEVDE